MGWQLFLFHTMLAIWVLIFIESQPFVAKPLCCWGQPGEGVGPPRTKLKQTSLGEWRSYDHSRASGKFGPSWYSFERVSRGYKSGDILRELQNSVKSFFDTVWLKITSENLSVRLWEFIVDSKIVKCLKIDKTVKGTDTEKYIVRKPFLHRPCLNENSFH